VVILPECPDAYEKESERAGETDLITAKHLPGDVFGAIVAATIVINETRGEVPGSTASAKWPQQGRLPLGTDCGLGTAEYVIVADANPPHIVLTRIQLY
jgi:hypothetical protein